MDWLEYFGAVLIALVVACAVLINHRIDRFMACWLWGWTCMLLAGTAFGAFESSDSVVAVGYGLTTLAPVLQLSGMLFYRGQDLPGWLMPAGFALAALSVLSALLSLDLFHRYIASSTMAALYALTAVTAVWALQQRRPGRAWIRWGLAAGFAALAVLEVLDMAADAANGSNQVFWPGWAVAGTVTALMQLVAGLERLTSASVCEIESSQRNVARDRFEALTRLSDDVVVEVDGDGRLIYVSPNLSRVLGWQPAEFIGQSLIDLQPDLLRPRSERGGASDPGADRMSQLRHLIDEGAAPQMFRSRKRDGSPCWLEIQAGRFFTPAGELRAVAVIRNVTEREALQELLLENQKLESLGRLAAGIAHDYNNSLTTVMGHADLALDQLDRNDATHLPRHLARIIEATNRCAALTDQLRSFAGKNLLTLASVNLSDEMLAARTLFEGARAHDAELIWEVPDSLPAVRVDFSYLRQAIVNLLKNAAESFGDGRGTVRLRAHSTDVAAGDIRELTPGRYVCLQVIDDGPGLSEELQPHVFEPFYSTKFVGRGMGLAAVQGILRSHNGAVTVQSQPGQGATFSLYLPIEVRTEALAAVSH